MLWTRPSPIDAIIRAVLRAREDADGRARFEALAAHHVHELKSAARGPQPPRALRLVA